MRTKLKFTKYVRSSDPCFKVGDVLLFKDGHCELVGDVNVYLGYCDHCPKDDYKIVAVASISDYIDTLKIVNEKRKLNAAFLIDKPQNKPLFSTIFGPTHKKKKTKWT